MNPYAKTEDRARARSSKAISTTLGIIRIARVSPGLYPLDKSETSWNDLMPNLHLAATKEMPTMSVREIRSIRAINAPMGKMEKIMSASGRQMKRQI